MNDGAESFSTTSIDGDAPFASFVAVADVDGDADADVVATALEADSLYWSLSAFVSIFPSPARAAPAT